MPKPPIVSSRQFVDFMRSRGWTVSRQSGSHIIMVKDDYRSVVIPNKKELGPNIRDGNLKTAGIGREEFERYFQKGKRGKKKPVGDS